MAVETCCQTPDAVYGVRISPTVVEVHVALGRRVDLTAEEMGLLEANLHNAVELVLAPLYQRV